MAIKVSQATIDAIRQKGMAGAIKQANSGNASDEFVEGAKRFYGSRVAGTNTGDAQKAAGAVVKAATSAKPQPVARSVARSTVHKAAPARRAVAKSAPTSPNVGAATASLHDKNAEREAGMSGTNITMPPSAPAAATRAVGSKKIDSAIAYGVPKAIGRWFTKGNKQATAQEKARAAARPPKPSPKPKTQQQIDNEARYQQSRYDPQKH